MNKTKMTYFKDEDILHFIISDGKEFGSIEVSPNISIELDEKGEIIGIEILQASTFLRDSILESAQAKILDLVKSRDSQRALIYKDKIGNSNKAIYIKANSNNRALRARCGGSTRCALQ